MRGDGVGVGDIGEVQVDARVSGDTAAGDDGGGAGREQDAGLVGGRGGIQRDASSESSKHRAGVGHGARGGHGDSAAHGIGSDGALELQGDGLGVRDIGQMRRRTLLRAQPSLGHDGGITGRKHEPGMDIRLEWTQLASSIKWCGDRLGVCDGAR